MFFKNGEFGIVLVFGWCKILFFGIMVNVNILYIIRNDILVYINFFFFKVVGLCIFWMVKLFGVLVLLNFFNFGFIIFLVIKVFIVVIMKVLINIKY